jgi:hypothetical protein
MRKRVLLLVVLAALLLPALSFGFDFGFGIKVGIGFPFATGTGYQELISTLSGGETKLLLGFKYGLPPVMFPLAGGVALTFGLFDFLAIQPEALFTMTGFAFGNATGTVFFNWSVIEVPLLVKLRLKTGGGASFNLYAGPDFQYTILGPELTVQDSEGNVLAHGGSDSVTVGTPLKAGWMGGVEFKFPGGATLEARYSMIFLNVDETFDWSGVTWATLNPANQPGVFNNAQVLLGFSL